MPARRLPLAVSPQICMRLTPRRPIGVLGLWHVGPGASRAASLQIVQAMNGWHPPHRHDVAAALCVAASTLEPAPHRASPRVCSGFTGEPMHADVLWAWTGTTADPPNLHSTNHSS